MAIGEPVSSISGLASGIQWQDLITQLVQIESLRRIDPLTQRIDLQNQRTSAWNSFSSLLGKLDSSAETLQDSGAFGAFQVSVPESPTSGNTLFSASASSAASPGSYQVEVQNLATAGKMGGGKVADTSTALGYSGTFDINGQAVTIAAGDSLESVRDKINAVNAGGTPSGVTAGIVSVSATESYLTLTADSTGARGIELVDSASTGGVLSNLGLIDTSSTVANTAPGDPTLDQTQRFSSQTTVVASMLGVTVPPTTARILVQGTTVTIDLLNDSLQEVLDKIKAADPGAAFVKEQVDGDTYTRISATGVAVDPTDVNSQRTLELLGFLKSNPVNSIQSGTDATVVMDGYTLTRRSNSISDAVAGVTLDLQNAEVGTTVNVTVSRDLDAIASQVKDYASAYNDVAAFVAAQRSDPTSALYSDGSLRSMLATLKNVLLSDVPGVDIASNPYSRTALVGVTLDRTGQLTVDEDKLKSALSTNFNDVAALFGTSGKSSNSDLVYVNNGSATVAGDYTVEISRAATLASHEDVFADATTSAATYTDNGSNANVMTVNDVYSGYSGTISLETGDDVGAVVSKLNQMFAANNMTLAASVDGSQLSIASTNYGSRAGFDVSFSRGGSATSSPIGYAAGSYAGLDVQGKIYTKGGTPGTTITGVGQTLSGEDGTNAEGLAIRYGGTATGNVGDLSFVLGAAGEMARIADNLSRASDGVISQHLTTISDAVRHLTSRRTDEQDRLDRYKTSLVAQFTAMETALSQLQAQGSWLTGQINSLMASA